MANLLDRIARMAKFDPLFVAFTWGAGGSTEEKTKELAFMTQEDYGLDTLLHLTCTNMEKAKIDQALSSAREKGLQNILALRGDPPRGQEYWVASDNEFVHAVDLVRYIRQHHGDYFCIGVAGYPEGHPDSADKQQDIKYLKQKIDAGADFVITQLFYDNEAFISWRQQCVDAGIKVPIIPCIMPIQSYSAFRRMANLCKVNIPQEVLQHFQGVQYDDQSVKDRGVALAKSSIEYLRQRHIQGFHFSTLNLEKSVGKTLEQVGFIRVSQLNGEGRQVETSQNGRSRTRRLSMENQNSIIVVVPTGQHGVDEFAVTPHEAADPRLWSTSAEGEPGVGRSATWDDFPNGRYGDARSPAYGELDGWGVSLKMSPDEARRLWGSPVTEADISQIFASFISGKCPSTPWSDEPPYPETKTISKELTRLISRGWWTVGSQPAVHGARSDDSVFGWGPSGGFVFQKAFAEFFISDKDLHQLLDKINGDPFIRFYAADRQGSFKTNMTSEDANAVTWGVFPGKEIVQPTMIEEISFKAWKQEAFEIWDEWSLLYPPQSPSRKLLNHVADTYWLCNIVHHDFVRPEALWHLLI